MREELGQFKSMRFKRFYRGEIHDGKTYRRVRERGEREREEGDNGVRQRGEEKMLMHNYYNIIRKTWKGMNQTKMEGGTERHLPKTDDWHRWVRR